MDVLSLQIELATELCINVQSMNFDTTLPRAVH